MSNVAETVYKIKDCYTGKDCIQRIIPYKKSITILTKNGILYHNNTYSKYVINNYLNDDRKNNFPYSNIPTHYQMRGLSKYHYTSQLLNFNEPYITISGRNIMESFVLNNEQEAILVDKVLKGVEITKTLNREELLNLFYEINDNEEKYVFDLFGGIYSDKNDIIPTEEQISEKTKKVISEQLDEYMKVSEYNTKLYYMDNNTLKYFKKCVEDFDINKLSNIPVMEDNNIIIVTINNKNIQIQKISVWFMKPDEYKVIITDYPISIYTLEEIKKLSKEYKEDKELKINLFLNPEIKKSDIEQARKLLKS